MYKSGAEDHFNENFYIMYLYLSEQVRKNELLLQIAEDAVSRYPESESIWINKGLGHLNLGQNEEFKYCQEQALKVNPNNTIALVNMSKYYLDKEDYSGALPYLEKSESQGYQQITLYNNLVICYMGLNQWKKAEQALNKQQ